MKVASQLVQVQNTTVSLDHHENECLSTENIEEERVAHLFKPLSSDSVDLETSSLLVQNCPICQIPFSSEKELSIHIVVAHKQILAYQCGICSTKLKTLEGCKSHFYFDHEKNYETKRELLSKSLVSVSYMEMEQPEQKVDDKPGTSRPSATATKPNLRKRNGSGGGKEEGLKEKKKVNFQKSKRKTDTNENEAEPGLVITASGERLYNVDRILRKSVTRITGEVWYRIKWEGWAKKSNTWERAENFATCTDLVNEFEKMESLKKLRKRRRGRGAKARFAQPPKQPGPNVESQIPSVAEASGQDLPLNREHLEDDLKQEINWIMDTAQKTVFKFQGEEGQLFRRKWRRNEVPISVVGSSLVNETLLYLVRISINDVGDTLMDASDFRDCVMVLHSVAKRHFPEMLKAYYDDRLASTITRQPVIEAAKEEILRRVLANNAPAL